jgi:peroxiredoxin
MTMTRVDRREFVLAGASLTLALGALPWLARTAHAEARVGAPAPAFSLASSKGGAAALADFKGKTVVLEWSNHLCPYVGKHYGGNNMQALQKKWTEKGIVWLTVISSAPGLQGHVTADEANRLTVERGAAPTAVLFDPTGVTGRAYGARTTPHMFVIAPDGTLVFMGGIDDKPTARIEDLKTARNYVDEALRALTEGQPIAVSAPRAYGCSVKYAS